MSVPCPIHATEPPLVQRRIQGEGCSPEPASWRASAGSRRLALHPSFHVVSLRKWARRRVAGQTGIVPIIVPVGSRSSGRNRRLVVEMGGELTWSGFVSSARVNARAAVVRRGPVRGTGQDKRAQAAAATREREVEWKTRLNKPLQRCLGRLPSVEGPAMTSRHPPSCATLLHTPAHSFRV